MYARNSISVNKKQGYPEKKNPLNSHLVLDWSYLASRYYKRFRNCFSERVKIKFMGRVRGEAGRDGNTICRFNYEINRMSLTY